MANQSGNQVEAHDGHGNSPAAWSGVAIIAAASVVSGAAVLAQNWVLFFIASIAGPVIGGLVWKLMSDAARKRAHG